jgi:hypothetical protein
MKTVKKTMTVLAALLIASLAISCATSGRYMPLSSSETVTGTVWATFMVRNTLFSTKIANDAVNTQAYIKLMEVAEQKYSGSIDLRDIEWVKTGHRSPDNHYAEITATSKVVQVK